MVASQFGLTEEERKELLPSGVDRVFDNRIGSARTYLKKAGLIDYPKRGYFKATEPGLKLVSQNIHRIDVSFLKQYPEFVEFYTTKKLASNAKAVESESPENLQPDARRGSRRWKALTYHPSGATPQQRPAVANW
jgi:restriction system protein